MDVDKAEDRSRRAASVLSMDDLEAAQALEGLRSGMWLCDPEPAHLECRNFRFSLD